MKYFLEKNNGNRYFLDVRLIVSKYLPIKRMEIWVLNSVGKDKMGIVERFRIGGESAGDFCLSALIK
ncbi:MAG: hypothetical protein ACI9XO_000195 [Paraglaciecola sp.]